MYPQYSRPEHLGRIETGLRAASPNLPILRISAQSLVCPLERRALVAVYWLGEARNRRQRIRNYAHELLRRHGYTVKPKHGRDVYDVVPSRPKSAHDTVRMLRCLRAACGATGAHG